MTKKIILLCIFISLSIASKLNIFNTISDKNASKIIREEDTNQAHIVATDAIKGQKLFMKKLQKHCDMSAAGFAGSYSQDEWEEIVEAGQFTEIITQLCPRAKEKYQKAWSPSLYQFVYEYASDSGNIPSQL
jgi:hypothetical protein